MPDKPIKILLVEDNPGDARLIKETLSEAAADQFEFACAERLDLALEHVAQHDFDVILLDLTLPDSSGLHTFERMHAQAPMVPTIVLTGLDVETLGTDAVQKGAQDYLIKGQVDTPLLVRSVRYAIERKLLQNQLLQSNRLESVGKLAAGVAHEINNPLAVVMGFSQLLLDQDLPSSAEEDVRRIYEHAQRASKVMENLLAFARKHTPERHQIDITAALANAVALKAHGFSVSNVEVILDPSPDIPHTMADEYQLQQVFLNIIANAGEAMVEAYGGGVLRISAGQVDNKLRVSFADDGPGISPETLTKIFDPFFTTKEVGKGTGLGLSICYGIIREHDGKIWAESPPGEGTTMHVELPIVSPDALLESTTSNTPANQTLKQHILVVDDESGIRKLLHRGLSGAGHTVDLSSDGQEAWDMMQENSYDCIIADLKMPGMSGQQLYKLVRDSEPDLAGKIVFVTGDTASSEAREFLEATGNLVLSKPFDLVELVRQIQGFAAPAD